jgi:hypothetical protein
MITSREVLDYVDAEPFRPFRIRMASGHAFDVRHPELIRVGKTSVRIDTATVPEGREKWHDASLMLMETVEPLETPAHQWKGS